MQKIDCLTPDVEISTSTKTSSSIKYSKSQDLLEQFGKHMTQIHGIEYQKESLMTMLASKLNKKS
jgi:hypothetical protein